MTKIQVAAIALAVAVLGGCANSPEQKVASANGSAGPGARATASAKPGEQGRKWAACMRQNGVAVDDPEPGGGLPPEPATTDPKKQDTIAKAGEKCRPLEPSGDEAGKPITPQYVAKLRVVAKCLRANGLPNYPDPDANGMVDIKSPLDEAAFEKARDACRSAGSYEVGLPAGGSRVPRETPK